MWDRLQDDFSMELKESTERALINVPIFNRNGADGQLDTQASLLEPNLDYVTFVHRP
ncbi:MAG UNVERIFIED_CONTAM: hypothetical protein LVT10_14510 [Anaerolineae bacterium]